MSLRLCFLFVALAWIAGCAVADRPAASGGVMQAEVAAPEPALPDPGRFEEAIRAFEEVDERARYAADPVVAVGSSSLRGWHGTIGEDLAPVAVIPRGFGGSIMNDVLHYADRIVTKYNPRAVLLYEGDNDIAQGLRPRTVLETYNAFFEKVWLQRDDTRIYIISVKPSPSRVQHWERMQELNGLLAERAAGDERLFFIDVATAMLTEEAEMRPELYKDDMLHMNEKGYQIWTRVVRAEMVERERQSTSR